MSCFDSGKINETIKKIRNKFGSFSLLNLVNFWDWYIYIAFFVISIIVYVFLCVFEFKTTPECSAVGLGFLLGNFLILWILETFAKERDIYTLSKILSIVVGIIAICGLFGII